MSKIINQAGFFNNGTTSVRFVSFIQAPIERSEEGDFFCEINCPELLGHTRKVFGTSPPQAKELAINFLQSFYDHYNCTDENGNKLLVSEIS